MQQTKHNAKHNTTFNYSNTGVLIWFVNATALSYNLRKVDSSFHPALRMIMSAETAATALLVDAHLVLCAE